MLISRVELAALLLAVWCGAMAGWIVMDEYEPEQSSGFAALEENVCSGPCNSTRDCQCQSKPEICSSGSCVPFTDYLLQRKPCPDVYKTACSRDEDCPCKTTPLICEDNECVEHRP